MKRKILSALLVLAMLATLLTSCFGKVDSEGNVTVVIENRDGSYTEYALALEDIENKDKGAEGLVEQLANREDDPLALDMQESTYGKYVNAIGSLTPDAAAGEYISIYTSVESDFDVSAYVKEITYKDITLKTSGVGLSSMKVPAGAIILFRIESYTG
ncbi:MAG: hypothetical protein IJW03_01555 [Clostridia bacterium]|nr:hypothetical protein [Clostridia bacterium]